MQPSTIDHVMLTTEQASQAVPSKQEGWANIDQLKKVATYNGTGYGFITSKNLNFLVNEGRLVRKVKGTVAYWRPVRSGAPAFGGGTNVFLDPYTPPGQDIPGKPPRGGQDGGKTPQGDEWNDTRYLAAGAAAGASGASGASGVLQVEPFVV